MKPKQHLEFVKVDLKSGWEVPPGYPPGFYQKILASDLDEKAKKGSRTRLLKIEPGAFSTEPFVHDHWEEVYVVQGDLVVGNDKQGKGGAAVLRADLRLPAAGRAPRPVHLARRLHPARDPLLCFKTGAEHLESLRDGRVVYIGAEKVDDVTTHPAFRNAARSMAAIYDLKRADPRFSFEEGGERFSSYFLNARRRKHDLRKANRAAPRHRRDEPRPARALARPRVELRHRHGDERLPCSEGFRDNLIEYYEHMRREDIYGVYAVIPPQAARNPEFYVRSRTSRCRRCAWCSEDDDGVVISGMKMLATGAVFANEIWIGNLIPLAPNQLAESITCAIAGQRAGRDAVVAQGVRAPRAERVREPAHLALRRDRLDGDVREREGAVGAGVRAHGRGAGARDLHQDAGPLLRQPPVERALPRQDAAHRRPGQQDRAGLGRQRGAGGARGARALRGARSRARRHDRRARSRTPRTGRRASRPSTGATCTRRSTGAPRAIRRSSTRCASCAAAACSRCPPTSR